MINDQLIVDSHDICEGLENVTVYFEDKSEIATAKSFKYVTRNIPHDATMLDNFEIQLAACGCQDNCRTNCPCITSFGANYTTDHRILPELLTVSSVKPMIECNSRCACDKTCGNRLVQFGVGTKIEIFKIEGKGFAVRSLVNIQKFAFVCEYAGEVVTVSEAKNRFLKLSPSEMNYLFVLREHFASGTSLTCVDPRNVGNIGRFLNHSCDPNLVMVPVRVGNNVPKLALFAGRDIPALEELTYDYSGQSVDPGQGNPECSEGKPCHCGSGNCRGFLPFDANILT